jgi:hypothetical protein
MINLKKLHTLLNNQQCLTICSKMKTKLSKKRAISTVLTTVIILVSSVVLGSGVVLYGTSLFQGGTQTENITVSDTKIWVHATAAEGLAWGATGIRNTGDKVVAVDKIQIRGQDIPFAQWYADTDVSSLVFQQALNHTGWSGVDGLLADETSDSSGAYGCTGTTTINIDLDSTGPITECIQADAATGPISLEPGQSAIIYFKLNNGTVAALDSGVAATVSVFAGKAGGPTSVAIVSK